MALQHTERVLLDSILTGTTKVVRHGECNRCGDCCRIEQFKIPKLWKDGKCIYLEDDECTVWGTDKCPEICERFPLGTENYLLKKLARRERSDFHPILPNCPFWFEVLRSKRELGD